MSDQNADEIVADEYIDADNRPISKEMQGRLDALRIENYEKILNDFAVREEDEVEEDTDHLPTTRSSPKVSNKPQSVKAKSMPKKGRPKKKKMERPEESETGEEIEISETKKTKLEPSIPEVESTTTGRPKREASIRASAMIIQTNEIEKTNYQYHYPNSNSATPTPQPPILSANNTTKLENLPSRLKTSQSFPNFQMPHHFPNIVAYTSFTKAVDAAAAQFVKPNFQKIEEPTIKMKSSNKQQINNKKTNLRQISTTTTLGVATNVAACGDDDSSDILIIDSPKPVVSNSNKPLNAYSKKDLIYPVLTEELIKEHNKTHDLGSGNGTFSSVTRDYIIRWVSEYVMPDSMPFLDSEVPLEAYGTKILNQPQYLIVKARQEGNGIQPAKVNSLKQPPLVYSYPKQTRETMLSPVPNLPVKNKTDDAEEIKLVSINGKDIMNNANKNDNLRNLINSSIKETAVSVNNIKNYSNKPDIATTDATDTEPKNSTDIIADLSYYPKKCISAT